MRTQQSSQGGEGVQSDTASKKISPSPSLTSMQGAKGDDSGSLTPSPHALPPSRTERSTPSAAEVAEWPGAPMRGAPVPAPPGTGCEGAASFTRMEVKISLRWTGGDEQRLTPDWASYAGAMAARAMGWP